MKKSKSIFTLQVQHPGTKNNRPNLFRIGLRRSGLPAEVPKERMRGVVSKNELPLQNQSKQSKIDIIKNSAQPEYEAEDEILFEMELNF